MREFAIQSAYTLLLCGIFSFFSLFINSSSTTCVIQAKRRMTGWPWLRKKRTGRLFGIKETNKGQERHVEQLTLIFMYDIKQYEMDGTCRIHGDTWKEVLVRKLQGKRPIGRHKRGWKCLRVTTHYVNWFTLKHTIQHNLISWKYIYVPYILRFEDTVTFFDP